MPQEKRDRARNMLEHGRSLEEASELTRSPMYLVRRLRRQIMAAQIIKRNRKSAREISFKRSGQFSLITSTFRTSTDTGPGLRSRARTRAGAQRTSSYLRP